MYSTDAAFQRALWLLCTSGHAHSGTGAVRPVGTSIESEAPGLGKIAARVARARWDAQNLGGAGGGSNRVNSSSGSPAQRLSQLRSPRRSVGMSPALASSKRTITVCLWHDMVQDSAVSLGSRPRSGRKQGRLYLKGQQMPRKCPRVKAALQLARAPAAPAGAQ